MCKISHLRGFWGLFTLKESATDFELWGRNEKIDEDVSAEDYPVDLDEIIEAIKHKPPNPQVTSPPTKSEANYAAEVTQKKNAALDVDAWDNLSKLYECKSSS